MPAGRPGLTKKTGETIRALARAVCNGQINFERIVDSMSS